MRELFSRFVAPIIDKVLGIRCTSYGYQYSEIVGSLASVYFCGGDCVEDVTSHLMPHLSLHPTLRTCSSDTILRAISELAVGNTTYTSDTGRSYDFNTATMLNSLLVNVLLNTGQLMAGESYDLDFDHQFIETEKYDAKMTYKKFTGYSPGVAVIGDLIVGIENRDGNANVRFHQQDTLERIYSNLESENIHIKRSRMDCGSCSREIVETVEKHSELFYIRANRCGSLYDSLLALRGWQREEINGIGNVHTNHVGHDIIGKFCLTHGDLSILVTFHRHPIAVDGIVTVVLGNAIKVLRFLIVTHDDGIFELICLQFKSVIFHDTDACSIHLFGNLPKARCRHTASSPLGTTGATHHDNAAVTRLVSGEITHKSGVVQLPANTRFMISITLYLVVILRRTSLSRNTNHTACKLTFGCASDDHTFQHGLNLINGLWRSDVLTQHNGVIFLYSLLASADFGNELRFHHATTISNGIIKHQELHRGDVHLIAN